MTVVAGIAAALTCMGLGQALAGWRLTARFAARRWTPPVIRPPVTILKPLHGDEPLLESALATVCSQAYPNWQVVFGVQDPSDPAIQVVERLRKRFPDCDMTLVVDSTPHGRNRKIANLINMFPAAKHDILVIADSDVHVRPDYLDRLTQALLQPGVGVVTTLYVGLPARPDLVARLGAAQITHGFLPGALVARAMGRRDCLGATMCVRREDLARIGGFGSLVDHLADDNVLGQRIKALGLTIALADTVPLTTVPETQTTALFRHELRWARTIRALEPIGFAASILQYGLFWALVTILLSDGSLWSIGLFALAWVVRGFATVGVDNALAGMWRGHTEQGSDVATTLAFSCPVWLLPLREVLSVVVMLASYGGRRVDWRGYGLHADTPPPSVQPPSAPPAALLRPIEGTNAS
jgi:ceramide glucosyltransferase